jgi:hypothetical protein
MCIYEKVGKVTHRFIRGRSCKELEYTMQQVHRMGVVKGMWGRGLWRGLHGNDNASIFEFIQLVVDAE